MALGRGSTRGWMATPSSPGAAAEPADRLRHPQLTDGIVARPRVERLLSRGAAGPVTLLSAGPGAGKTLAVAAWAATGQAPGPVAWLTLDETDNDPVILWRDMLAALTWTGALPARAGLPDQSAPSAFGAESIRRVTTGLRRLDHPVMLVLDDLHAVVRAEVLADLDHLVTEAPRGLRLVLVSRPDPPLRLHRLRLAGDLVEIRGSDLAFDAEEADQLFRSEGVTLDPRQSAALVARTEGWAAGLRLAVMSLAGADRDQAIREFSGSQRSVADYLVEEVLDRQPAAVRRFLLHTSIAERVCAPLADVLTGRTDGQRVLEELTRANVLVLGDADNGWFRYHPLLREMLQHQLRLDEPSLVRELHLRAMTWFSTHGDCIDAIRHASAAEAWPQVRRLLVDVALPRLLSPERGVLASALRAAAAHARISPDCDTLIAAAACNFFDRKYSAMAADMAEAERRLFEVDEDGRESAVVALRLFQIAAARIAGDADEAARLASEVLRLLDGTTSGRSPAARQYRVIATGCLGAGLLWTGQLVEARQHLETVSREAEDLDLELPRVNALSHLATIRALQGGLREARSVAAEVLAIADRRGWGEEPQVLAAHLAMGLVNLNRDDIDAARTHLLAGLDAHLGQTDGALRLALHIATAHAAAADRDIASARLICARLRTETASAKIPAWLDAWLLQAELETLLLADRPLAAAQRLPGAVHHLDPDTRLLLVRAHLAMGHWEEAERLVSRLFEHPGVSLSAHVGAWLAAAVLAGARHEDAEAIQALRRAAALAAPEQLLRPFRAWGPTLSSLVARHQFTVGGLAAFAASWPAAPGVAISPDRIPVLAAQLTPRERAVLSYLPSLLTNEEIGESLVVSVNTVKAHLKSVYRKLEVSGRREAIRRARELDLL